MLPDDHRHGTNAGHVAGCRLECCRIAKLRYDKRRKIEALNGIDRRVPVWRVHRRIGALQALGWSITRIAEHSSLSAKTIHGFQRVETVYATTFAEVDDVYQRLSGTAVTATTPGATRAKRHALRMGYPPPLAYDNIDDENEQPRDWHYLPAERDDILRDLADRGAGITEACRALHVSQDTLQRWASRHGLSDVYRQLAAREWDGENQWMTEVGA